VEVAADSGSFSMALESSCVIDFAYVAPSAPLQPNDIVFAQSTDCGASFKPTNVTHSMAGFPFSFSPQVVTNKGVASIVWVSSPTITSLSETIFAAERDSAGNVTVPANLATSSTGVSCLTTLAVPGSSNTGVGWCDGAPSANDNGGNVWALASLKATPAKLGPGRDAQFAADASGDILAAWELVTSGSAHFEFSTAGQAGTFSSPTELFPGQNLGLTQMTIGAKENVDLLVVHEQRVSVAADTSTDTLTFSVSRSTDGGSSFSAPVTVSKLSCPLCGSGVSAEMAEDTSGLVDVAWENEAVNDTWGPFSFSQSNAQVTAFSTPAVVPGTPNSPGAAITTDPDNHVLLFWSNKGVFMTQGTTNDVSTGLPVSGSVSPTSATIAVGSSANFTVNLTSTGGFNGQVNLACSGEPSGVGCTFNPGVVNLPANGTVNSILTVSVSAKPSISGTPRQPATEPVLPSRSLPLTTLFLVLLAAALFCYGVILKRGLSGAEESVFSVSGVTRLSRSYAAGLAAFVLVLVLAAGLISCGGSTSKSAGNSGGGTTAATGGTGSTAGSSGSGGGTAGGSGGSSSGSVTTQLTVQAQSGGATTKLGTISITVP